MKKATYERLPNETGPAWAAFTVYRDMGPARTMAETGRQIGRSAQHMYKWDKKYNWKARAKAWDKEVDTNVRFDSLEAISEMKQRQIEISLEKQELVKLELAKLLQLSRDQEQPIMSVGDLGKLWKLAVEVERLSRGEATDRVETKESGIDYSKLTTEELRQMRELATKAERKD